jgi:hypothetical protein
MYCSIARSPHASEFQLIERATCLAAIAIKRHNEMSIQGKCGMRDATLNQGCLPEWPLSMN